MGTYKYIKEFGLSLFLVNGISRLLRNIGCGSRITGACDRFKHKVDERYLYRKYKYLLTASSMACLDVKPIGGGKNYTFVFWWQGIDNAPEVVKLSVKSITKNSENLVVIDKDNLCEWVSFPDYVMEKFRCGYISLAHFSDILRFYLLYVYGGTWIDATCFLSKKIPDNVRLSDFWSVNGAYANSLGWHWTSFFMCGKAGNVVAKQMLTFYYDYWMQHDCALTYLFLDCWMTVLCKYDERVGGIIEKLPDNGYKIFFLISNLNREYTHGLKDEVDKTFFVYKLTYKEKFEKKIDGKATLYGHLLSLYGITC